MRDFSQRINDDEAWKAVSLKQAIPDIHTHRLIQQQDSQIYTKVINDGAQYAIKHAFFRM